MLKPRSGSSSSNSPKKIFGGVRFVLFGFDSVSEAQYRSELVRRGGTDVSRYDRSCTHVIVSGRVYDDPVCVAAQKDGKILVTELWIDDSMDFEMIADASRVMYRPVKDLNGIPGSESLYICLTGYQRQEREDIMKMVSLMGARFSKPLIANQVTHLICYKFEGEKYELAKKVKIKLVNHRWLEDCLKAWEILPIDNYTKSGWELEILEAEARDSEEETEDPGMKLLGQGTGGPLRLQGEMPAAPSSHVSPNRGMFNIQQEISAANLPHTAQNLLVNNGLVSTPCKGGSSVKPINMDNLTNKLESGCPVAGGFAQVNDGHTITDAVNVCELSNQCYANIEKHGNTLLSDASIARMGSLSSGENGRFSALTYSGKTKTKSGMLGETSSNLHGCVQENLDENFPKGDPGVFQSMSSEKTKCEPSEFQSPTSSNALPQKRKVSVERTGSKSPKSEGQNSRISPHSPATARSAHLESISPVPINHGLSYTNNSTGGASMSSSKTNEHPVALKLKSLSYKKRSLKRGHPASETKIASCTDTHIDEGKAVLLRNAHPNGALDEPTETKNKLPFLETSMKDSMLSPADCKAHKDFVLDGEPRRKMEAENSLGNTASILENLVIDIRSKDETTPKQTSRTSFISSGDNELAARPVYGGDVAMEDVTDDTSKDTAHPLKLQQDERVLSSDSRDSEVRKLSSTASTSTDKENATNTAPGVRTKKVASRRNISCRPKLTTRNTGTYKSGPSDETITPGKAAVKAEQVGRVKAAAELEKANNNPKKQMAEPVPAAVVIEDKMNLPQHPISDDSCKNKTLDRMEVPMDPEKENRPKENSSLTVNTNSHPSCKVVGKNSRKSRQITKSLDGVNSSGEQVSKSTRKISSGPAWFILSGHRFQRKEFQNVIRRLKGKFCRDSHSWSYQATHFVVPDPVRRTEKFFAAAAAGRWILKTDYLTASNDAGKFLDEEPFEWHSNSLTEDGAISLEAPRKWRLLRERTGHGALYGMKIIIYGECIAPTLDTLKRVVKAGDGTILATSPPYSRFLKSGVDFAIVSPGMLRVDSWVQEFLRHEIPCVLADYLVEYVCKPGYSLEKHVLYKTHSWAEKSFANLLIRSEEVVTDDSPPSEETADDLNCSVCGLHDRKEVMLICGDEGGAAGCSIAIHIDCCDPPLDAVPEGDWFCPDCSRSRSSKTPLRNAKKKPSSKCK